MKKLNKQQLNRSSNRSYKEESRKEWSRQNRERHWSEVPTLVGH